MSYPEGFFITPGNVQYEWIFAIVMPGLIGIVMGLIAIYIISKPFIKIYIKSLGKKSEMKLVELEDLNNSSLFRKIWVRSIILGFFVGNLCYTLASQEVVVQFMRSVSLSEPYTIPDVETMWQLAWLIIIPCSLIVIPIYVMSNVGLVRVRKVQGVQFKETTLASSPLYRVIKGYAGIGFIYNLVVMIFFWVTSSAQNSGFEIAIIIEIISPLIAAASAFPGVLLTEHAISYIRAYVQKVIV